jgi:hypothetical protein
MTLLLVNMLSRKFIFLEKKADSSDDSVVNCLNLKSVCTISLLNEPNSGFSLQSIDESVVLRTGTDAEVLMYGRSLGNHNSKINLSATKHPCSSYQPADGLNVNQKRIYNSSSHQQKNDLMLNPSLFPNCILSHNILLKALLSAVPSDNSLPPILGCLSSSGSLELSRYVFNFDSFESSTEKIAEVCDIRKQSYDMGTYAKLEKLQEIINEVSFETFDWCPEVVGSSRLLAALSKSNEIVIYSISSENEVLVEKCLKLDVVTCEIKWVVMRDKHFLLTCHKNKKIARYAITISTDSKVTSLDKVDELESKLNIPPSYIEARCFGDNIVILCSKSHSVEVVNFNESGIQSITKHVGLSITGITSISENTPEYLISTLNNEIFFLKLATEKLKVEEFYKVDNTQNPDIQPSKFGAYGISASKNKVLIFVSLFPQVVRILDMDLFKMPG